VARLHGIIPCALHSATVYSVPTGLSVLGDRPVFFLHDSHPGSDSGMKNDQEVCDMEMLVRTPVVEVRGLLCNKLWQFRLALEGQAEQSIAALDVPAALL
jgi:hypothetical protein